MVDLSWCVCVCVRTVVMVCLLRYAQIIEHSQHCWTNTSSLMCGFINAVGLVMVGNFQVCTVNIPHVHNRDPFHHVSV